MYFLLLPAPASGGYRMESLFILRLFFISFYQTLVTLITLKKKEPPLKLPLRWDFSGWFEECSVFQRESRKTKFTFFWILLPPRIEKKEIAQKLCY